MVSGRRHLWSHGRFRGKFTKPLIAPWIEHHLHLKVRSTKDIALMISQLKWAHKLLHKYSPNHDWLSDWLKLWFNANFDHFIASPYNFQLLCLAWCCSHSYNRCCHDYLKVWVWNLLIDALELPALCEYANNFNSNCVWLWALMFVNSAFFCNPVHLHRKGKIYRKMYTYHLKRGAICLAAHLGQHFVFLSYLHRFSSRKKRAILESVNSPVSVLLKDTAAVCVLSKVERSRLPAHQTFAMPQLSAGSGWP